MRLGKRSRSKKTTWRNRALFFIVVLLLGSGAGVWYFKWGPGVALLQPKATGPQTYTIPVKRGDLRISAAGSGKLVAYQSIDLSFSTSGVLAELNVQVGDTVKAGQVLACLGEAQTLEANLAAARLRVLTAQKAMVDLQQNADLALAQAYSDLVVAQESYAAALKKSQRLAYARCGQDVTIRLTATLEKAAQKLSTIHAETVGSDVYIAAKKAYDTALANYDACAAYTTNEKDSVQSAFEVARADLQEAQDQYDTLKTASGVDPNQFALNEANLKVAQAQLAIAEEQLAGVTLIAPLDGKITYLSVPTVAAGQGALVGTAKFITIIDISRSTLEISVDESDLNKLAIGAAVTVTFDALPDQSFTGQVIQVNPQITTSGQYRVAKGIVELDSEAVKVVSALPVGLSASVTVKNKEATGALLVPVIALKDMGDGSYGVMAQGSDGQLKLQMVTIGIQDNDYAEITSGLQEGDLVSTGTVNFIAAGSSTSSNSLKNAQNSGSFRENNGPPPAP